MTKRSQVDPAFFEWSQALALAFEGLSTTRFPQLLVAALKKRVHFDQCVIFAYRGNEIPLELFSTFGPKQHQVFVTAYQAGPYLLDPFFHSCRNGIEAGTYRLSELAPDRFYQTEYFRSYYIQTGLAEEIAFILGVPGDITIVISLMRLQKSHAFSSNDLARLYAVEPMVLALARNHWKTLLHSWSGKSAGADSVTPQSATDSPQVTFDKPQLTRREREVVGLVLRGHSSESIARLLEISPGTVKIHRKNLYSKLGVSSQSQLFSMFFSSLYK